VDNRHEHFHKFVVVVNVLDTGFLLNMFPEVSNTPPST